MASSSWVVDRRNDNPNKSASNRERFIKRYKEHIRGTVQEQLRHRSIQDMEQGTDIQIERKHIDEPSFRQQNDGIGDYVRPGNDQYSNGDAIAKPSGGKGKGGGEPGDGKGEDMNEKFIFTLTKDEFMSLLFEDMELPNLEASSIAESKDLVWHKAGFSRTGNPANLAVGKTLSQALGRQLAMASSLDAQIEEAQLHADNHPSQENTARVVELQERRAGILFLEDRDLRYRTRVSEPLPISKAVMFCVMDVSGSMTQHHKDLAKRFFLLLYLFLSKKYSTVDIVFVRHTNNAEEVNEHEFFYGNKSGGTEVMSGLSLVETIQAARYPANAWNLYFAQVSDGDAFDDDGPESALFLRANILSKFRYGAYLEVGSKEHDETSLWAAYQKECNGAKNFAMRKALHERDIYPVLRGLFERKKAGV